MVQRVLGQFLNDNDEDTYGCTEYEVSRGTQS
jgi:hypothetical protein